MAQATLVSERLCGDLQQPISAMAWSVDGEFLAITSTGGELLLLDFRAGCEELLRGDHDSSLDVVGFSGDGQFLMAAGHGSHPPGQRLDRCSGLAAGWLTAGQLIKLNFDQYCQAPPLEPYLRSSWSNRRSLMILANSRK